MPSKIEEITQTIIAKLKSGTMPWERPWTTQSVRPLRHCGTPYKGLNVLWLWMLADAQGYTSPYWMTFRQAKSFGAHVRKGERGAMSYFYKPIFGEGGDEDNPEITSWILKTFRVFNADQIEDLTAKYHPEPLQVTETDRTATIDAFFGKLPDVRHGGNRACYDRTNDVICLPHRSAFRDDDHYASTKAHEFVHFTGHPDRLNRVFGERFGDKAYAFEELVACLGQALIGAELGLPTSHLDSHAAYIDSWVQVLEKDHTTILTASRLADNAVAYLFDMAGMKRAGDPDNDVSDAPSAYAQAA